MSTRDVTPTPESRVITAAIDAAGISKAAIADHMGVTPGLVSQWALGRRPVAATHAPKLAALLHEEPERVSAAYRDAMALSARVNGSAYAGEQGPTAMDERDRELVIARLENDVHALNLALGTLVAVMVQHRPREAEDAAGLIRRQVPSRFRDKGLIHELLTALERSGA